MLEIKELYAYYGKAKVLRNIHLSVDEQESVAILGPNGAGKTTLMNSICGLVKTKGKIYFNGCDLTKLRTFERMRKGIAISPEGRRLFLDLTVEDNLKITGNEDVEFVYEIFPELYRKRFQLAKTLSGGEQQMLAIARALMLKPKLLLLDEPSLGLAPLIIEKIADVITQIRRELNLTILLVEQNLNLASEVVDKAYILLNGKIVWEGEPDIVDFGKFIG